MLRAVFAPRVIHELKLSFQLTVRKPPARLCNLPVVLFCGFELQLNPPSRPDNVEVARTSVAIILTCVVQLQRQVLVERMTDAATKTITGPNVQTPVVKHFVGDKPGEFFLIYLEWMLELHAISIAPGLDLRRAPASFEPTSISDSEFACRNPDGRAERYPIFRPMPTVWRPRLPMEIKRIE